MWKQNFYNNVNFRILDFCFKKMNLLIDRSFGIVLYTLTTGSIPFHDEYYEVIRLKILSNISTIDETKNYRIYSKAIIALLKSVIIGDAR